MKATEKARELKGLTETNKTNLFIIEKLSNSSQTAYLDLRNGFSTYKYVDGNCKDLQLKPNVVKTVENYKHAEKTHKINKFL